MKVLESDYYWKRKKLDKTLEVKELKSHNYGSWSVKRIKANGDTGQIERAL